MIVILSIDEESGTVVLLVDGEVVIVRLENVEEITKKSPRLY